MSSKPEVPEASGPLGAATVGAAGELGETDHDGPSTSREHPVIPPDPFAAPGEVAASAATVVPVRQGEDGNVETLLVQRNASLKFAGGLWVWPGGRIDPGDHEEEVARSSGWPDAENRDDDLARWIALERAARRAAVREAAEESSIVVDPSSLVWFAHWTPPGDGAGSSTAPKRSHRFRTYFFLAPLEGPRPEVRVDGSEIQDHRWIAPATALEEHAEGRLGLSPPTFVTLSQLAIHSRLDRLLDDVTGREPDVFATSFARVGEMVLAIWQGDDAYPDGDPDLPGRRHRLTMAEGRWLYERTG